VAISPFDSGIFAPLLGDERIAALFDDGARIRSMLRAEAALARAQARIGLVPDGPARRIDATAARLEVDPATLGAATARDGIPVTALVQALREALDDEAAGYVHWGATSQDILDTALVLALRDVADLVDERCRAVSDALVRLARSHRDTLAVARTRTQQAVPTSFGLKVAGWAEPLIAERRCLVSLRPRLLRAQLGGAGGNLSVFGPRGPEVLEAFAAELDLGAPALPWHAQRESLVAFGDLLARITGALGKLGQDVTLMCQNEVGELRIGTGGGSSAMPHKSNPVAAETLVALARAGATAVPGLHHAQLHAHERDGAAWMQEWIFLPQLCDATAAALAHAERLVDGLEVDTARMHENATGGLGLVLAEAATCALAAYMPPTDARRIVTDACHRARTERRHLLEILEALNAAPVDWGAVAAPDAILAGARVLFDRFMDRVGPEQ